MVADNILQGCGGFVAVDTAKMIKALVALGMRRGLCLGEHFNNVTCDKKRVFHLVLRAAGVDIHAVDDDMQRAVMR